LTSSAESYRPKPREALWHWSIPYPRSAGIGLGRQSKTPRNKRCWNSPCDNLRMQADTAFSLVSAWVTAHAAEQGAAQGSYSALHAELVGLLPETNRTAVVMQEKPAVIAVDEGILLTVTADQPDEGHDAITWRITFHARPLRGSGFKVMLLDESYSTSNITKRDRIWHSSLLMASHSRSAAPRQFAEDL
jgi:hypothetical protein